MNPEQTIHQIRQLQNVVVLLISQEDELSIRAQRALGSLESRLRARGFQVAVLEVSGKTAISEELACVRVPQLRFFLRGRLQHKITGLFDDEDIELALKTLA